MHAKALENLAQSCASMDQYMRGARKLIDHGHRLERLLRANADGADEYERHYNSALWHFERGNLERAGRYIEKAQEVFREMILHYDIAPGQAVQRAHRITIRRGHATTYEIAHELGVPAPLAEQWLKDEGFIPRKEKIWSGVDTIVWVKSN